jgi:hypothetical protein
MFPRLKPSKWTQQGMETLPQECESPPLVGGPKTDRLANQQETRQMAREGIEPSTRGFQGVSTRLPRSLRSARQFAEGAGQCVHDLVGVGKRERHRAADLDDVVVRPVGAYEHAALAHAIDHEGRFV